MEHPELVFKLQDLRERMELEAEAWVCELGTTVALVLSDVCDALGLSLEEHDQVLGLWSAYQVRALMEWRPGLPGLPERVPSLFTAAVPAGDDGRRLSRPPAA